MLKGQFATIKQVFFKARLIGLISLSFLFFTSCEEAYTPKPKAYYRISLPEKKYQSYSNNCPYKFDYPVYARVVADSRPNSEKCWINIDYPAFDARVHISYKEIKNNLATYIEDSRSLTYKHIVKAADIREDIIIDDSSKVYGLMYDVTGNAASHMQFYLTDSTQHFLRGSLYFNSAPNYDSILPVLEFIKKDIYHMMNTFEWK
jgi:gliding motility-associated lipoprotein GldD